MNLPAFDPRLVAILASAVLIVWRVRSRVRRFVGRQRLRPLRSAISVVFFAILAIVLLVGSFAHPRQSLAELGGIVVGIGLAIYGLRLTRFERTPSGFYYTPNAHIGIALSLLLVARIGYRLAQAYLATAGFTEAPANFGRSPLTLLIVGILAGYFAGYSLGLLRRYRLEERRGGTPPSTRADA